MSKKLSLLAVLAHPDDESFGPGGTLARYAAEGVDVHVVIATDGIAGSVEDNGALNGELTLAQVRSTELSNAAVELGVTSIWSLPYRDSGMRGSADNDNPLALIQQPVEQLTAEIGGYIERLRPQVIITHDPYGGYGHPDHIRCCEATTAAFHAARTGSNGDHANFPQKLYYTAFDKRLLKVIVRLMPLFGRDPSALGRNRDINLVEIAGWESPIHAKIDIVDYLPRKDAASKAHVSQYSGGPTFIRVLPPFLRDRVRSSEGFTRAFPAPEAKAEADLFANVVSGSGFL